MSNRPVPNSGIHDDPKHCLYVNVQWAQFILELLEHALETGYWNGDDEELLHAETEIGNLIEDFGTIC